MRFPAKLFRMTTSSEQKKLAVFLKNAKLTPTTIRSAEEIFEAIGGDLSKAGTKRDLYDTVIKVLTGFGIRRQDPKLSFRFNLGKYSGELSRIQQAFTTDVVNANKLQKDARLIARGLEPETLRDEYG